MDLMAGLLERPPFSVPSAEKDQILLDGLKRLTMYHQKNCAGYGHLSHAFGWDPGSAGRLVDLPWLPVGIFKTHRLVSVSEEEIYTEVRSSGTTGQAVSRVGLDRGTADLQARSLNAIMSAVLGTKRRPMIIVDTQGILHDPRSFSARGAGVLGMMRFGRRPIFVLDEGMEILEKDLADFLNRHAGQSILIFGFTFMIWEYLLPALQRIRPDLGSSVLIHSGGWKKLQDREVGNEEFKAALNHASGLRKVYNFYGMAEQVGSIFLEGDDGFLYPPSFADVIVRDPRTWEEVPVGKQGVLQVVSLLPTSYPGHSLLTEDLGVVEGIDDSKCGRLGKRFKVIGRVPHAEIRGCSDTFAGVLGG